MADLKQLQSSPLWLGVMSGTSTDGMDVALLRCESTGQAHPPALHFLGHAFKPFSNELRQRLLNAQALPVSIQRDVAAGLAQSDPLLDLALLENALSEAYAQAILEACEQFSVARHEVAAVVCHGQTIRHRPDLGVTSQILNPHWVAERTGLNVIADLRRRDVCLGGQGAPMVPSFHQAWLSSQGLLPAVMLNLGGFSNVTLCRGDSIRGGDCGPANVLMDAWTEQHLGKPFDDNGAWAATGSVDQSLLTALLAHPFLSKPFPRSTGRDDFHLPWLLEVLSRQPAWQTMPAQHVQATLLAFSVAVVVNCLRQEAADMAPWRVIVCGGGAKNQQLLNGLEDALRAIHPAATVRSCESLGLPVSAVEATAFAWLGYCWANGIPGHVPGVTGASQARLMGSFTPA